MGKKEKRGRPSASIDWKRADDLLIAGCKGTDVAAYFGVHANTLYRHCEDKHKVNFSEYLQQKRSIGDCMIHVAQFDEAVRKRNIIPFPINKFIKRPMPWNRVVEFDQVYQPTNSKHNNTHPK